ncbi:hypothetical protein V1509DRAFT_565677 [Lipomyces kononenkoae]
MSEYLRTLVYNYVLLSSCLITGNKIAYYYQQFDYFRIGIITILTYLCCLEFLSVSRISTGGPKKTSPPTASGIFIHDTKLQYKFNGG